MYENEEKTSPSTSDDSINRRKHLGSEESTQKEMKEEKELKEIKEEKELSKMSKIKKLMAQHHIEKKRKGLKPRNSKSSSQCKIDSVDSFFYFYAVLVSILKLFGCKINYSKIPKKSIEGTKKFRVRSLILPCEGEKDREIDIRPLFENNYSFLCKHKNLMERPGDKLCYIDQKTIELIIDILGQFFSVVIVEKGYKKQKQSKGVPVFKPTANQITFTHENKVFNFYRNDISALGKALIDLNFDDISPECLK